MIFTFELNLKKDEQDYGFEPPFSRRQFLRGTATGIGAAALWLGTGGQAFAEHYTQKILKRLKNTRYTQELIDKRTENIEEWGQTLPPGISHSRDPDIVFINRRLRSDVSKVKKSTGTKWLKFTDVLSRNVGGYEGDQVLFQTEYLEPAWFFNYLKAKEIEEGAISNKYAPSFEALKFVNPALYYFNHGFLRYERRWKGWVNTISGAPNDKIEDYFLNSIFCAAYPNEAIGTSKAKEYMQTANRDEKLRMLSDVIKNFKKMKKDIYSCDPNDGYNRCLVGAWSSFLLTRQWEKIDGKLGFDYKENEICNNSSFYAWKLEYPIKKALGHWIRGGPKYGI